MCVLYHGAVPGRMAATLASSRVSLTRCCYMYLVRQWAENCADVPTLSRTLAHCRGIARLRRWRTEPSPAHRDSLQSALGAPHVPRSSASGRLTLLAYQRKLLRAPAGRAETLQGTRTWMRTSAPRYSGRVSLRLAAAAAQRALAKAQPTKRMRARSLARCPVRLHALARGQAASGARPAARNRAGAHKPTAACFASLQATRPAPAPERPQPPDSPPPPPTRTRHRHRRAARAARRAATWLPAPLTRPSASPSWLSWPPATCPFSGRPWAPSPR